MSDEDDEANGSAAFRFLRLTDAQADGLRNALPQAEFGQHYKTGGQVGVVPLRSPDLVMKIEDFRRAHQIRASDCDLFISIYSVRGDETWQAPRAVNYLVNIVNCPIVFSFSTSCRSGKGDVVGE